MSTFLPEPQYPDDLDPQSTLDALDQRLVDPTLAPPDLLVTDAPPPPLGRSWAYDFQASSFVQGISGVAQTRGISTLKQWVEKCLRTDRGAHPIYSDDFGIVRPFDMIGMALTDVNPDDLEQRIREALTKHPSIADIDDFDMTYSPDGDEFLLVTFTVKLIDQQSIPLLSLQLP